MDIMDDVLGLLGVLLIAGGLGAIYWPLTLLWLGGACLLLSYWKVKTKEG